MQAVILAAGLGTRLRPIISEEIPKVMLRLNGKPLLQYAIENLKKNKIEDIVIAVHYKKEQVIDYFGNGKEFGVNIQYVVQENPKGGTADALRYARNKINGEFLLVYGDNLFAPNTVEKILEKQNYDGILAVKRMENISKFGVVDVEGDRVVELVEKPDKFVSNLALAGLFVLPYDIFKFIEIIKPSKRNEYELTDAIQLLIKNNYKLGYIEIEGFWADPRDAKELELAKEFARENYDV